MVLRDETIILFYIDLLVNGIKRYLAWINVLVLLFIMSKFRPPLIFYLYASLLSRFVSPNEKYENNCKIDRKRHEVLFLVTG